jgi:polar amino acid transport system substrate-binding protein
MSLWSLTIALACGPPRDPEATSGLALLRGLRVGVVLDAPWACLVGERRELAGAEVELVRDFARAHGAGLIFEIGGEARLLAALRRFELDLVVGGLVHEDLHAEAVDLTRPHYRDGDGDHVLAVPPGEEAWATRVEAFAAARDVAAARLRGVVDCGEP